MPAGHPVHHFLRVFLLLDSQLGLLVEHLHPESGAFDDLFEVVLLVVAV